MREEQGVNALNRASFISTSKYKLTNPEHDMCQCP